MSKVLAVSIWTIVGCIVALFLGFVVGIAPLILLAIIILPFAVVTGIVSAIVVLVH